MHKESGAGEAKKSRTWLWWAILVLAIGLFFAGYKGVYEPRVVAKNYASYTTIVLMGVETKLQTFEAADPAARAKILESLPGLWDKFCEIECPDQPRGVEIEWKMAKLFAYTRIFMEQVLADKYIGAEKAEATQEIEERIAGLKWLLDDTTAYGNFKRLK
jgi:hypothetical protein